MHHFSTDVHLSGAVLDTEKLQPNSKKTIQLWIEHDNKETLIGNLCRNTSQIALDIGFSKNEKVIFSVKGVGNVHLHGYFVPDEDLEDE